MNYTKVWAVFMLRSMKEDLDLMSHQISIDGARVADLGSPFCSAIAQPSEAAGVSFDVPVNKNRGP